METKRSNRNTSPFGSWLASQIATHGFNQLEFSRRVGVSHSTVSRWIAGRIPEATLLERIADVLLLDYDLVATKAGIRPPLFEVDPESPEGQLVPLIRKVVWTDERLEAVKRDLHWYIERDNENRKRQRS